MRQVLSILFGAGFTVATAWALGRVAFQRLRIRLHRTEHDLLAGVTGAALLSLIIFLLCAAGIATTASFLVLGAGALFLNYRLKTATDGAVLPGIAPFWVAVFSVGFAAYTWVYLANGMAPDYSPDGQTYHLGLVYRFFRDHGFRRITTSFYSNLPLGMEMLFLDAFSFGRQSAASTLHTCTLLALPFLMVGYARRIGHTAAGVGAALMVFFSPIAGWAGTSAYNDMALTTASFAAFYLVEIWREDRDNELLPIAIGLVAGFCFAIKYTGFTAAIYVAIVMLWYRRPKALALAFAAAAVIALPWLVKNWMWLGNPVSPFLNRLFPNPYIHIAFEDFTRTWFRRYDIADLRPIFWMVTVTGRTGGQLGPWFLLAPLGLVALCWKAGRYCVLAAVVFMLPYPQNIGTRFLLPAIPFVALAMALVLERWRPSLVLVMAVAAVLGWPRMTGRYDTPGNIRITGVPWKAALRKTSQDEFMGAHSAPWITARMLDYFVPRGKRVLSTTPVAEGYAATDVMVTYQSGEGDLLQEVLTTATQDGLQPTWNWRFTFPPRSFGHLRLAQTAAASDDNWSIGELRFFAGATEIPVSQARLDATPFPFDIALVADRNPATRWKTWQSIRPGMHVDAEFTPAVTLDRVEMHSSHDQGKIAVHLESCDGPVCPAFEAHVEKLDEPAMGDLRKDATAFLRSHGIAYLLIDEGNWLAKDIQGDPARWNMTFVAERASNRLYVLN